MTDADFIRLLTYYFVLYLKFGAGMDDDGSWRKIFHKRVLYPPPKDHPLVLMRKKPEDPLQP